MPRLVRTKRCDADLFDISVYIAQDNPSAADALIDLFDEKFGLIAEFPTMGRLRPELGKGIRSLPVGAYLVFYRSVAGGVQIIRVLHGARNVRRLFRRRS